MKPREKLNKDQLYADYLNLKDCYLLAEKYNKSVTYIRFLIKRIEATERRKINKEKK